ncbi:MAG: hypothetical protein EOS20_26325 [Mesorhizobium sp.]|nr:MAG: hypothetical protein EOS20_26325 [Mesorhizobium sp.]
MNRFGSRRTYGVVGRDLFRAGGTAPPSVLPDISPTWGEIGCHPGFRQSPTVAGKRDAETANLPPRGEMSGRTEGGAQERNG